MNQVMENFEQLLNESLAKTEPLMGNVVDGTIINILRDFAVVDVGLKSEGRVPLKELMGPSGIQEAKIGDKVSVYVERMEDREGLIVLSREKARREAAWVELEKAHKENRPVLGVMFGRVKGGFTVDLSGAVAFLPGSQVDVRPIKDVSPLMGIEQPFQIVKMDRARGNIVVSRRAVMEESRSEQRSEILANLSEGHVIEGTVKNITDYGAFIDMGGVDGLLHVTDISWRRITHPAEVLQVGQTVKVQVIKYNRENQRVSLGMKQLESDPWSGVEGKYIVGQKLTGAITNIADYGAFVELEPAIEGLIHVSEMSWTKKNLHPNKILTVGQAAEVMVLEVDVQKRRIALGIKQCTENPWERIVIDHPVGSSFEGEVRNVTEFGLFVAVSDDLDGMVHMSDLSWNEPADEVIKSYKRGDRVTVKVLEIDPKNERVALGIKQLESDPFEEGLAGVKKGDVVTCEIKKIVEAGLEVVVNDSVEGFIRKADLSKERSEQRTDRFAIGEKVDARITAIDRKTRNLTLSIKAREIQEEREAMEAFGSVDSGASLGDILGAAFDKVKQTKD